MRNFYTRYGLFKADRPGQDTEGSRRTGTNIGSWNREMALKNGHFKRVRTKRK